jgi:hypothetical protein
MTLFLDQVCAAIGTDGAIGMVQILGFLDSALRASLGMAPYFGLAFCSE